MMRVISKHLLALERQVREFVNIERCAKAEGECLNLKNEWAGSKIPGLNIMRPKGVASSKEDLRGKESSQVLQAALRRGCKRLNYVEEEEEKRVEGTEGDIAPKEEVREKEPPNTKRQRQVGLGDGWEMITPVKWKGSPLDKGRKTFTNIRKVQPE